MFIKPSKKWRNPEGDDSIMVPYTYYRLCESFRDADGKTKQRTVLGLGELLDSPTSEQKQELADLVPPADDDFEFCLVHPSGLKHRQREAAGRIPAVLPPECRLMD